jgi:C-terminal processing protease CtpA/Prc
MVVENGAAHRAGCTKGSLLVAVNGQAVHGMAYTEILELIKAQGRPMTLRFERKVPIRTSRRSCCS